MKDFYNKVVVITGGNSGIGEAIAHKFDQEGAKVVIFGRDQNKLDAVCQKLHQGIAVKGDIQKLSDIENLFKITEKTFGKVDVLVANAGIASRKVVDEVDEDYFDEMVNINYKGVYFTVQRSIPLLNPGASVILISSIACHVGILNHSVYSSTKAAVSMLARNFAADLIKRKIRVNAISPGFTDTPIFDSAKKENSHLIEECCTAIPLARFGDPSEIAEAAAFLSSPQAAYIVGIDLVVDGGVTAINPL